MALTEEQRDAILLDLQASVSGLLEDVSTLKTGQHTLARAIEGVEVNLKREMFEMEKRINERIADRIGIL